uniref:Uncharacterized protein n=1 Tax=Fibrocapsa japonica TaxID=94617 RepID=A0A7S2XYH5_9STRA
MTKHCTPDHYFPEDYTEVCRTSYWWRHGKAAAAAVTAAAGLWLLLCAATAASMYTKNSQPTGRLLQKSSRMMTMNKQSTTVIPGLTPAEGQQRRLGHGEVVMEDPCRNQTVLPSLAHDQLLSSGGWFPEDFNPGAVVTVAVHFVGT